MYEQRKRIAVPPGLFLIGSVAADPLPAAYDSGHAPQRATVTQVLWLNEGDDRRRGTRRYRSGFMVNVENE
jgi:hypothetical protein